MGKFKPGIVRPDGDGIRKALGDLEAEIMEIAWEKECVSVRDVHATLSKKRDLAYTTVMTVMGRLANKELLRREKKGKQFLYCPSVSRADFDKSIVRCVMDGLRKDLSAPALAYFVEEFAGSDEATLAELERMIAEKRRSL